MCASIATRDPAACARAYADPHRLRCTARLVPVTSHFPLYSGSFGSNRARPGLHAVTRFYLPTSLMAHSPNVVWRPHPVGRLCLCTWPEALCGYCHAGLGCMSWATAWTLLYKHESCGGVRSDASWQQLKTWASHGKSLWCPLFSVLMSNEGSSGCYWAGEAVTNIPSLFMKRIECSIAHRETGQCQMLHAMGQGNLAHLQAQCLLKLGGGHSFALVDAILVKALRAKPQLRTSALIPVL